MQSSCLTQVWVGPHDPPHCPPSGLKTPPAGWDPPSVKILVNCVCAYKAVNHLSIVLLGVWCVFLRWWNKQTSSKNCCVRRRMCLSSVSSRKFFFSASWLVLISFSSFSSFSKVAYEFQEFLSYQQFCPQPKKILVGSNFFLQLWLVKKKQQSQILTSERQSWDVHLHKNCFYDHALYNFPETM